MGAPPSRFTAETAAGRARSTGQIQKKQETRMNAVAEQQTLPGIEPQSISIIQVIERAARDPNIDIDKMERLLAMQERIVARDAETRFNVAMTAAQGEMGAISADAMNPQTHSKYASYAKLDKVLRPIYIRHGFALSFDEGEAPAGFVLVLCRVSHSAGHTRSYRKLMPADGKGAKGGDVMTLTHASGAAMTYGMRYLLKGIFNVAVGEEDTDGNSLTKVDLVSEEQIAALKKLAAEVGADMPKFLRYAKIESLDQIPAANYAAAVEMLETKRKEGKKS
jgi:hypothetical protein